MPTKKKVSPRKSLTPKEKMVLEFLEQYILENDMSPSFREIKEHFGFASFNSVQRYVKQLEQKSYIRSGDSNQKRAIELVASATDLESKKIVGDRQETNESKDVLKLPLLGRVAAGSPIERKEYNEFFEVNRALVPKPQESFVLRVEGDSMIEDGILDGDFLIVQSQKSANKGDTIVAMVEEEATVKNFFKHSADQSKKLSPEEKAFVKSGRNIELRPANSSMRSMFYSPKDVNIQGVLVGLVRKY